MKSRKKRSPLARTFLGSLSIGAGLVLWLLLSPGMIALGGERGTFISYWSWLGLGVCILGVGIVIYGIAHILSA
jgi:uncharacterized membrane protein YczE